MCDVVGLRFKRGINLPSMRSTGSGGPEKSTAIGILASSVFFVDLSK